MQKKILKGLLLSIALVTYAAASEERYAWKPEGGVITMDVVKNDGVKGGGTWLCKSLKDCYIKVLQAEERGATQYCETITLKRDGQVVWYRDYNAPYWVNMQRLKSRDWFQ